MAQETKEQKELRRVAEEHSAMLANQEWLKVLPRRIFEAQSLASMLTGITVITSLTPTGPIIQFQNETPYIDIALTYQSEKWEMENLEEILLKIKERKEAFKLQGLRAQEIFGGLSPEDKVALRTHIHSLR
jgi:hypothetical protein